MVDVGTHFKRHSPICVTINDCTIYFLTVAKIYKITIEICGIYLYTCLQNILQHLLFLIKFLDAQRTPKLAHLQKERLGI